MCNLYSFVTSVEAFRQFVKAFDMAEQFGNLQPLPGVFPDYPAPIIRNTTGGPSSQPSGGECRPRGRSWTPLPRSEAISSRPRVAGA